MNLCADLFECFLKLVSSLLGKNQINKVLINTIDNPGWGVTIGFTQVLNKKKIILSDEDKSNNDWFYCVINDNKFEGDGGISNLTDILITFIKWISKISNESPNKTIHIRFSDDLIWLEKWYSTQCDGEWEQQFGVKIESHENIWLVQIDIIATKMENVKFQKITINRSMNDFISCEIKQGIFESHCGAYNLPEVLRIFRHWVEGAYPNQNHLTNTVN